MDNKYIFLEQAVFRTPLYSFDKVTNDFLLRSKEYNEAIKLASPEFFNEKIISVFIIIGTPVNFF